MGISRGLTRKDGPFSWLVAVAMSLCFFIEGGLVLTGGIFFAVFLDVFNEERGKTALISSMNHGSMCLFGKHEGCILRMHHQILTGYLSKRAFWSEQLILMSVLWEIVSNLNSIIIAMYAAPFDERQGCVSLVPYQPRVRLGVVQDHQR